MRRVGGWGLLALTLAMVLGVGSASGRTATITTVTVEIIGGGKVKSTPKGLDCGDDNNTGACYVAFSGTGSVDLEAFPDDGWMFEDWNAVYDTDCNGVTSDHCIMCRWTVATTSSQRTLPDRQQGRAP